MLPLSVFWMTMFLFFDKRLRALKSEGVRFSGGSRSLGMFGMSYVVCSSLALIKDRSSLDNTLRFMSQNNRKITLCLKLVRIMLETWNLARKYTKIFSFRKCTVSYTDLLNVADVRIFWKKISFFCKNNAFTQSNIARAVMEIF